MKGQVRIMVKNPQGEIVKEVNQTNRVFDIPKIITNEMFAITIENYYRYNTDYSSTSSLNVLDLPFSLVNNVRDWFRSIKINDERFEEDENQNIVDNAYLDWKIPQLYGSDNTTKTQTNNDRYVYINANYSSQSGKVKKMYYSWISPITFTMRSINLCHYDAVGRNSTEMNQVCCYRNRDANTSLCFKYGNFYFGYPRLTTSKCNSAYNANTYGSFLAKNPYFQWSNNGFRHSNHLAVMHDYNSGNSSYGLSIYPLPNNEIALLRFYDDLTTIPTLSDSNAYGFDGVVRYLTIIDNETGETPLRQFHISQFQDIGSSSNSSSYKEVIRYAYPTYFRIVSTENRNFLVQFATYRYGGVTSTTRYRVWEIPSTQITKTVPCVGTLTSDTIVDVSKTYYTRNTSSWTTRKPGEYVDEYGYLYTEVSNPTGNPKTNNYYEIVKGVNGTEIPYIEIPEIVTNLNYSIQYSTNITNHLLIGTHILTFNDDGTVSHVQRYINNGGTSSTNYQYDAVYLGKTNIPGLTYGIAETSLNFPVWYNTACMNLDEDITVPQGYTLTVEYTVTAN